MTLSDQLALFPLLHAGDAGTRIAYRQARPATGASATPIVLLHGIGSASASWLRQLQHCGRLHSVLAWNAPGYSESTALPMAVPTAHDYARSMWSWLDALKVGQVTLVGHSLGALMAAAATRDAPHRVRHLVLLAPALGYATAAPEVRAAKLNDRLRNLETLGPQGMADKRGAAMLSGDATPEQVEFIKTVMAQIEPHGYAQAAHMLSGGNLAAELAAITCPITVASGQADTITPPAGCQRAAEAARTPWIDLGAVGHACPLEAAEAVNRLIESAART